MTTFEEANAAVDRLTATALAIKAERDRLQAERDRLRSALGVVLDCVDYTAGACRVNEMVGAVLPREVIEQAKAALR